MSDQPAAARLAREGFDLWQDGQLENAVARYRAALDLASPDHYALADYYGEFACVLEALGNYAEARNQLELAVAVQVRQDGDDSSFGVIIARAALADHLVRHDEPSCALEVIAPSLATNTKFEWLLGVVKAEALAALDRVSEAQEAADLAILTAPFEAKRSELVAHFAELFGEPDAAVG